MYPDNLISPKKPSEEEYEGLQNRTKAICWIGKEKRKHEGNGGVGKSGMIPQGKKKRIHRPLILISSMINFYVSFM